MILCKRLHNIENTINLQEKAAPDVNQEGVVSAHFSPLKNGCKINYYPVYQGNFYIYKRYWGPTPDLIPGQLTSPIFKREKVQR